MEARANIFIRNSSSYPEGVIESFRKRKSFKKVSEKLLESVLEVMF